MKKYSASCPNLGGASSSTLHIPPPVRLVRSFRCSTEPIPYFLQDLLSDTPCISRPESQSRIIELIRNIQFQTTLNKGSEGKLWFEIRRILKKNILADDDLYTDGRKLRNHLFKIVETERTFPEVLPCTPTSVLISRTLEKVKKFETLLSPTAMPNLLLLRQTSG